MTATLHQAETSKPVPAPRRDAKTLERMAGWSRRAPLLPALIFIIAVTQLPFVATIIISLFSWNSLYPNDVAFGWFSNYISVFSDETMRNSVITTIVASLLPIVRLMRTSIPKLLSSY